MSCTLKIKYADIEIDFIGEESFAEKHLFPLVHILSKAIENGDSVVTRKSSKLNKNDESENSSDTKLTTSTIATKLGSKTGPHLAAAAAYALHLKGEESFTRNQLTHEMKGAKTYYKDSYQKNLSNTIATLVKQGSLLDQGSDKYALSVSGRTELDQKLAK